MSASRDDVPVNPEPATSNVSPALPPRDRRYSLCLIAVFAFSTAGSLPFPFPLARVWLIASAVGLVILLLNHRYWRVRIFPYDHILSAVSTDGLNWTIEPGVRLDVGGLHDSCMAYYPEVVAMPGGWRIYYRAGGYDSIIASAFSRDGISWEEEPGARIGQGGEDGLRKADGPEVIELGPADWRMYYAGFDGEHWRIYSARSSDGLHWRAEAVCIDAGDDADLPQAKDPSVIRHGPGYRIYFTRFSARASRIYTAFSRDGAHWQDLHPCAGYNPEGRDTRTPCAVGEEPGNLRLYFAEFPGTTAIGSRIVSATSEDGVNWARDPGVRLDPGAGAGLHGTFCPDLVFLGNSWRMYFGGFWGRHWLEAYTLFRHRERRRA